MSREEPSAAAIAAELEAIDATLAGDPVDPVHAELAELALLLVADRPSATSEFADRLDERMSRGASAAGRTGAAGKAAGDPATASKPAPGRVARPPRWRSAPVLGGSLAAGLAIGLAVLVIGGSSSGPGTPTVGGGTATVPAPATPAQSAVAGANGAQQFRDPLSSSSGSSSAGAASPGTAASPATGTAAPAAGTGAPAAGTGAPSPNLRAASGGRQVVASAQLQLAAAPTRIDAVAGELFQVVGSENGFVLSSTVTQTGGPDGYAHLELSLPSANLAPAMAELSRLSYASVSSRTDASTDVSDQVAVAGRQLADARAVRAALLRQLSGATTPAQVQSLRGRLHDADGAISRAEQGLASLRHRVAFSSVSVTIAAASRPVPVATHRGGLTAGRALHDAGRVLSRGAGVAVLVAGILLPPLLLAGAAWWLLGAWRRRRRERALDLAA